MDAEELAFKLSIQRLAEEDDRTGRTPFAMDSEAAAFHLWQGRREELRRSYRERLREFASLDARASEAVVLERRFELDGFKRELWVEVWLGQNLTAPELVSLLSGPDEAWRATVFRVIESGQGAPFTFEERAVGPGRRGALKCGSATARNASSVTDRFLSRKHKNGST